MLKAIVVLLAAAGVVSGGAYGATQVIPEDGAEDADSMYDDDGISIELDSYDYGSASDTDYADDYGYDNAYDESPTIEDEGPKIIPIPRSGGTTTCSELGSFTNCSGPGGQSTTCSELGSFTNCITSGGYDYGYDAYQYDVPALGSE